MSTVLEPLECPIADVASVPRRFGVGVLLILMTAFAVLFAIMRTFGAPPPLFLFIAGLFLAVTLGQILLFEGKKPRQASMLCGAIVLPTMAVGSMLYAEGTPRRFFDLCLLFGFVLSTTLFGAGLGYLAGCVMAGVFFVQEHFARRSQRPLEIRFLPFTPADFHTLKSWVRHRPLFELWSQGRLRYPLDDEQMATLASPAEDFLENRFAFKAVLGEMQEMVGYVELAKIDYELLRANVELAIVDPARDDRDRLSDLLVQRIVDEAFQRQQLRWLSAIVHHTATGTLECFRKAGFSDGQTLLDSDCEYRLLTRGAMSILGSTRRRR